MKKGYRIMREPLLNQFGLVFLVACSDAAGANVFGGFLTVNHHLYFLQIGIVGFGSLSVGVAHLVTGHFAFSAYSAYLGHIYTSVVVNLNFVFSRLVMITFIVLFGKQIL